MMKMIEETFKKRLGDDVSDVKYSVNAVMHAIKSKSSKEEVLTIITER